jgi:hypothetical protein
MSLAVLANHMASKGRNGDSMLVHMAPSEVAGLQALGLSHGITMTINPHTGLPEAFSFKKLLKSALPMIAGFALGPAGFGIVSSALGAGALVGGATALATGSLQKGIMAGLGAYGGASLGNAFQQAGMATSQATLGQAAAEEAAKQGLTDKAASEFIQKQVLENAAKITPFDQFKAGIAGLGNEAGRSAFMSGIGGASGLMKAGYAAAAPIMADQATQTATPMPGGQGGTGVFYPYKFNPFTKQWTAQPIYSAAPGNTAPTAPAQSQEEQPPGGMAGGGIVALAAGGPSLPSDIGTYTPQQKADLYNKFLSQGFNDAAIRQAAGQQTDTDWQTLQQLAAQRGSPAVSGAERTVLTSPDWTSVGGQTGLAGLNQNIQNFVQQNPNLSYSQIQAAANQYGVDAEDIRRAIAAGGGSGGLQNVLTQADWRSRTGLTGLEGMNKNIQMWVAENPQATEAQIRQAMQAVDINEADVMRATGKSVADLAYKPVTAVSPTVTTSPGSGTTYTPAPLPEPVDFAPTTPTLAPATQFTPQTMEQVRTAYEQGGGATEMPTVTRLGPNERPMTQNAVVDSLQAYLANNPNATATEITAWGRANGVPDYQLRAAVNERRFSMMTGGTKNAYDYLMGRGAYPTTPFVPGGGALMRPYSEVVGGESAIRRFRPTMPPRSETAGSSMSGLADKVSGTATTGGSTAATSGVTGGGTSTIGGNTSAAFMGKTGGANTVVTGDNRTYADQATIKGGVVVGNNVVDPISGRVIGTITANVDDGTGGIVVGSVIVDPISGRIIGQAEDAGFISRLVDKKVGEQLAPIEERTINLLPERQPERSEGDDDVYSIFRQPNSSFWFDDYGAYSRGMDNADTAALNSGGITALAGAAKGGQFNLGGYSDGGRLLRGPGDGVSDSIPATIGNRQPARLADGEFVIPARIVSEIGNGSTEAGARKLYAMMDRVQRARAKTTGKGKVAKNTRADKYLPA